MASKRIADAVCRGCWRLGNNCGSCPRCRREAAAAFAERDDLRQLIDQIVKYAGDAGFYNVANEISARATGIAKKHEVKR